MSGIFGGTLPWLVLTGLGVGLWAGLITRRFLSISGPKLLNHLLANAFYGIMGAVLAGFFFGPSNTWGLYAIPGALVAVSMWTWGQRFRQVRRDADERDAERVAEAKQIERRYASVRSKLDEGAREEEATRPKIFINYRHEDDIALAGRIAERLENEFGTNQVFIDVDAIPYGADFVKAINAEVAKCDVLLALIGRNWLDMRDEAGHRRLDDPADFVRLEIAAALKRQIPIIPILVDGTKIPPADRLPEELKGLERHNALDLRNASFREDMDRLVRALRTHKSS
jgi:hypothetical protein